MSLCVLHWQFSHLAICSQGHTKCYTYFGRNRHLSATHFFIFVSLLQLPFCTISLFIFYGKPCLLNFSMLRVSCFCLNVCHQCHFLSVKCNMFGTYCISEKVALVFWIIVDIIRSCLTFLPYCPVYECVTFRSLATTIALKRTTELSTRYIMYYLDVTRLK